MNPGPISSYYYALNRHAEWNKGVGEYNYRVVLFIPRNGLIASIKLALFQRSTRWFGWIGEKKLGLNISHTRLVSACDC
jgi:hypothetical protein